MTRIGICGGCLVCHVLCLRICDPRPSARLVPPQEMLIPLICMGTDGLEHVVRGMFPCIHVGLYLLQPKARTSLPKPAQPEIDYNRLSDT